MRVIGLTGGIGMGKSTAAAAFRRARLPVFDADRAVHRLQGRHGAAVPAIAALLPQAVRDGRVDRVRLRAAVTADPARLRALEAILHPMVRKAQQRFLQRARRRGCPWVVLDIPLLLERGGRSGCDLVVVVSAPAATQIRRLRQRRGMTSDEASVLIARQMPDAEKRRRADVVIRTGLSRWHSLRQIRRLLRRLRDPGTERPR